MRNLSTSFPRQPRLPGRFSISLEHVELWLSSTHWQLPAGTSDERVSSGPRRRCAPRRAWESSFYERCGWRCVLCHSRLVSTSSSIRSTNLRASENDRETNRATSFALDRAWKRIRLTDALTLSDVAVEHLGTNVPTTASFSNFCVRNIVNIYR